MPNDRNGAVKALAAYLTAGPRIAAQSIALEIGGAKRVEAEAFFELRNAFGINGYADADQAERAIEATLAQAPAGD